MSQGKENRTKSFATRALLRVMLTAHWHARRLARRLAHVQNRNLPASMSQGATTWTMTGSTPWSWRGLPKGACISERKIKLQYCEHTSRFVSKNEMIATQQNKIFRKEAFLCVTCFRAPLRLRVKSSRVVLHLVAFLQLANPGQHYSTMPVASHSLG